MRSLAVLFIGFLLSFVMDWWSERRAWPMSATAAAAAYANGWTGAAMASLAFSATEKGAGPYEYFWLICAPLFWFVTIRKLIFKCVERKHSG